MKRSLQRFSALTLIMLVGALSGCSYRATSVHNVDVERLDSAHLSRTAVAGLIIRSNYTFESETSDDVEQRRSFDFSLAPRAAVNPFANAPELAEARSLFQNRNRFDDRGKTRKAKTLLEAYCAAINDLEPIRYFEQSPTGLGRDRFIRERNAVADSLAMVAHAYVDRSLRRHLSDTDGPLGTVVPHQQVLTALAVDGADELYDRVLEQVRSTGEMDPKDCRELCQILGVEALLFVAVSYDYVTILHTSQYGSWYSSAIRAETDAAVFGDAEDQALATVGFSRVHEEHLDGLDDVGKLIGKSVRGGLTETSAASRRQAR